MKLIDLLVQELPKRGGWPDGALNATQDKDGEVCFSDGAIPEFGLAAWTGGDWCGNEFHTIRASDYATSIITRDQYGAALAASKAVVGHNGWIQWTGGDCPVDSDAIVEVKYRIPKPYQYNNYNDRAGDFDWEHIGSNADIIAYRLLGQGINARANDEQLEQDLNECIGQGVAAEWDGEGLPPVGCECEVKRAIDWVKCKILFISEAHVVLMADEECCWNTCACQFRPLHTEADKKRQVAAQALCDSCGGTGKVDESLGFGVMWFDIYDAIAAGKIPGVKLEGK